jgi:hypothetical protein
MNSVSGDHSLSAPRGLDYALLQSQLVCLFYILLSCCVTMYRGSVSVHHAVVCDAQQNFALPLTPCTPPPPSQAWHNDGWHLPMVAALAFSTYLKLASWNEDHMASHNHKG